MSESPRVHLICQAHLDPVWQWNWQEGLTEAIATFEVAADLLDEYPEFVFNHNEALLYEWTERYRPELFERIRNLVRNGRWKISGGWFLQPDCNLPSGESFARHALIGRRYFQEKFGAMPVVAYNLDPFGHHGNMPQILRKTGHEMYVHFRPTSSEKPIGDCFYRWRGVDGSEIIGLRPPHQDYISESPEHLRKKIESLLEAAKESGRDMTVFWGAGDHGGGATRRDLDALRKMAREFPEILQGSFDGYWDAVKDRLDGIPVVEGDLQKCFTGCYTSVIGTKQRNRRGEGLVLAAERYATLAWWVMGRPYPSEEMLDVWKGVLFNQFHDILPGSSVRHGFEGSIEIYGHAFYKARQIILESQLALLRSKGKREAMPLCIFNPLGEARRVPIEVEFMGAHRPQHIQGKGFRVLDSQGRSVPFQHLAPSERHWNWQQRILVEADVPAMGMAEYRIETIDKPLKPAKAGIQMRREKGKLRFLSRFYSLTLNTRTGLIESLKDKTSGRELLKKPGGELIVREDIADSWGTHQFAYGKVVGRFRCPAKKDLNEIVGAYDGAFGGAVQVIESGPLATRIEVVQAWGRSVARLRYTLYANHPEIGLEVLVNWTERMRALQLAFPTNLFAEKYITEIPHGAIKRAQGNGEEPCGRWILLPSEDGKLAFGLANDGPGGVEIRDGELRQSLVRSPIFCTMEKKVFPDRLADHMDLGEHILNFRLRFGKSVDVRADLPVLADDLVMPPTCHVHIPLGPDAEEGLAPGADQVNVKGKGVQLAALKRSEDEQDLIVRLVETTGRKRTAQLEVAGMREIANLEFGPYEIKTLRVSRDKRRRPFRECDLLERPLD
ncbi:alpha-mannosidase [bacterium]|nr:alpha-mannosidase [bacterium]